MTDSTGRAGRADQADRADTAALAAAWRADLAAWAIPDDILAAAPESPWRCSPRLFAHRADAELAAPTGPTYEAAWEALVPAGSVLDVGAGAGAASLPLAPRARGFVAVDQSPDMLSAYVERAARLGVPARAVVGRWPDVAAQVPPADVAVCRDVVFNVPDLVEFVTALTDHARRRVVVEFPERHPLSHLAPLWRRFHGLDRPDRPTADDAIALVRSLGHDPRVRRWSRPSTTHADFDEWVAQTCRILCLPPERAGEVRAALREHGLDPPAPRAVVTVWWPGRAD